MVSNLSNITCRTSYPIIINYIITVLTSFVFAILVGKVYDPADIEIVNKPNGFEEDDICGDMRNRRLALGLP